MLLSSSKKTEYPWERWTDEEWRRYQATLQALNETDEQTLAIVLYQLQDPPLSYVEIAEKMNRSEQAVRLCIARFYERIHLRSSEDPPTQDESPT